MQVYATLLLCMVCFALGDDILLQKRNFHMGRSLPTPSSDINLSKMFYPGEPIEPYDQKIKRPFCNAFTGCGKRSVKRSGGGDNLATLVDLNSEPAVEDLSRQILSEAKLWEAIQEARMELANRKLQQEDQVPLHPMPLPLAGHKRSQYYYT